jgi:hypothetical protein
VTPLYPQKLTLTSPTGGGRSVGIVRWRTKATEFSLVFVDIYNGPTNALVCNKTLIQMSNTKTFKITPTCFDYQIIIITELFNPG